MKKSALILLAAGATAVMSAKIVRNELNIIQSSVPETETITKGTMEFVYDYTYSLDSEGIYDKAVKNDKMLLQIGSDGISKFSSYKNLAIDSLLMKMSDDQITAAASEGKLDNGEFMTIFKNYPSSGVLTHTEKICQDWLKYEEELHELEWELTDSVTNVLGYECKGAKCSFRGREWTAFYAEEIPMSEGPWKLQGLPGLIMKASDAKGEYIFECIGIKSRSDRPITIYKVPFNKVDRKGFYDIKHRYDINPFSYFEATTGGKVTVTDEAGNPSLSAYDPVELPYEYIEKDWRK